MRPNSRRDFQSVFQKFLLIFLPAVGVIVVLLAFWPGFMEYDSYIQYGQAIGILPLDDWHPANMTLLWRTLLPICDGPQPMLVLQALLYWSGFLYLAIWLWRDTSRFILALSAVIVPFAPFLINFTGVIWKDTHLALALFWATLLLVIGKTSWKKLISSLLLICYGLSVRHNGIAAALPLLGLWSYQYLHLQGINKKYGALAVTLATLFFCLVVNSGLNSVFSVMKTHPLKHQLLNDIVAITCSQAPRNTDILEEYYGQALLEMVPQGRQNYLCDTVLSLASTDDTEKIFDNKILDVNAAAEGKKIISLWARNVIKHPFLYLKCRLRVFTTFLRPLSYSEPYYVVLDGMEDESPLSSGPIFEALDPFGLATLLVDYVKFFSTGRYSQLPFRPLFWLTTLLLTTSWAAYKRQRSVFLVASSGLLYIILYFPVIPAPDFRYCYYSIFAQIMAMYITLDSQCSIKKLN